MRTIINTPKNSEVWSVWLEAKLEQAQERIMVFEAVLTTYFKPEDFDLKTNIRYVKCPDFQLIITATFDAEYNFTPVVLDAIASKNNQLLNLAYENFLRAWATGMAFNQRKLTAAMMDLPFSSLLVEEHEKLAIQIKKQMVRRSVREDF